MTTVTTTTSTTCTTTQTRSHQRSLPKLPNELTGLGRLTLAVSLFRVVVEMKLVNESGSETIVGTGLYAGGLLLQVQDCVFGMIGVFHVMLFPDVLGNVVLFLVIELNVLFKNAVGVVCTVFTQYVDS